LRVSAAAREKKEKGEKERKEPSSLCTKRREANSLEEKKKNRAKGKGKREARLEAGHFEKGKGVDSLPRGK